MTYTVNADAFIDNTTAPFPILALYAEGAVSGLPNMQMGIGKTAGGSFTAGTYTVNQFPGILVAAKYTDASSLEFSAETDGTANSSIYNHNYNHYSNPCDWHI